MNADELLTRCDHFADDIYVRREMAPGQWSSEPLSTCSAREVLHYLRLWLTSGHIPIRMKRDGDLKRDKLGAMTTPTKGRNVYFHAPEDCGGEIYPAIITRVTDLTAATVDLVTFGPDSIYFQHNVPFSEEPGETASACWSWPPRL